MTIRAMNWSQVEAYLKTDDRAVVPLGSTEQHAGLSLSVDSILSERVATEAAAPLGVAEFGAHEAQQIFGVGLVEHREPRVESNGGSVLAQKAVGDGVKGAPPYL